MIDEKVLLLNRMVECINTGDSELLEQYLVLVARSDDSINVGKSPLSKNCSIGIELEIIREKVKEFQSKFVNHFYNKPEYKKFLTDTKTIFEEISSACPMTVILNLYKLICYYLKIRGLLDIRIKNIDSMNATLIDKFFNSSMKSINTEYNISDIALENVLIKLKEFFNYTFIFEKVDTTAEERDITANYMYNLNKTIINNIKLF